MKDEDSAFHNAGENTNVSSLAWEQYAGGDAAGTVQTFGDSTLPITPTQRPTQRSTQRRQNIFSAHPCRPRRLFRHPITIFQFVGCGAQDFVCYPFSS
jgi:hypothetical protein